MRNTDFSKLLIAAPMLVITLFATAQEKSAHVASSLKAEAVVLQVKEGDVISKQTSRGESVFLYGTYGIQTELFSTGGSAQYIYDSVGVLERVDYSNGRRVRIGKDENGTSVVASDTGAFVYVNHDSSVRRAAEKLPAPASSPRMQAALEKVAFGGGSDYCPEGGTLYV